ncbi:MAG: hypothetical protein JWM91_5025 [Rhodospirillales bacterium]|nr:hypothetical protein [Rhodospirillales bacterium]
MRVSVRYWIAAIAASALFGCGPSEPQSSGGAAQVRRLTEEQYRQVIADLFGKDIKIAGHFDPLNRTDGLLEIGASRAAITSSAFEQYDLIARQVAAQVIDEDHRNVLVPCSPASETAPDPACAREFFAKIGPLLYRRPVEARTLDKLVAVAGDSAQSVANFYTGLASGLAGMLETPEFLFVADYTEPDPNHPGQRRLDAYSRASRLSFLLWNTMPDAALLKVARDGDLNSKRGLKRQVDRMLASPRLAAGVRAFFADMLGFDTFDTLAKDPIIYPAFVQSVADDAQEQTLRTITDLLIARKGDYRDLFTTRETVMGGPLGLLYDVPVTKPDGWAPYTFSDDDPRAGIITQLSFVVLHSHPGRSSATLRGKAVREIFLCQKVPDPPGNVNFSLVQDTKNPNYKTARQRLTAHRSAATCAGCHKIMDPIGLALENFDGAGQYRTVENDTPIDASGEVDGVKFQGAAELGKVLHDNPAATSCLVNRLYGYATGRPPVQGEKDWMKYLQAGFAENGYRVSDLLRLIATSDAFYEIAPASGAQSASEPSPTGARS